MTATSVAFADADVVRGFVEGGVEIMMIWIEVPLNCWLGPGQYDWSYAEEKLSFFEEHAGDTHWLIRIRLGLVNGWFAQAFPDEVHGTFNEDRSAVCVIHSSLWLREVSQVLFDFVSWLKTTRWAPRIIGFMLNAGATEEWLPFDVEKMFGGEYHPVIEREFKSWLAKSYGDEAALQAAWNEEVTFEGAQAPSGMMRRGSHIWGPFTLRDPQVERPALDYYRFLNETLADALITFCQRAKDAAGTPVICGGFHSYLWWESGVYSYIQEYGHGLIQRLNQSPSVDFVSDITSYDGRFPGGPSGYLGLPASHHLHGKSHFTEVDITTCANMTGEQRAAWEAVDANTFAPGTAEPALPDRIWKWDLGMCGRDESESIAVMQREHAHNLITGTPYWWFDIKARSFATPALTGAMKQLSDIGKQAVKWNRASRAEVAFVCSEETPMFQSAMNGSLLRFELEVAHPLLLDGCTRQWGLAGVPFDTYELGDLAHPDFPGDQLKLLIFVNCAKVSDQAAQGIKRWQTGGKTLLWTFASACLSDEKFDVSLGEELVGMRLGHEMKRRVIRVDMNETGSELTRGGAALGFGTDIAVGPTFFADDEQAEVLGRLRDGGEAGFALRRHANWNALYLSMLNFGPQLLRNLARFSGAHVWCESNDVLYANQSLLCFHSASAGEKTIRLPREFRVSDLLHPEQPAQNTDSLRFEMDAYRTAIWRLED